MRNKSRDHSAVCCVAQSQVAWTDQLHITLLTNSAKRHQWKLRTFPSNWFDFASMILNHMQGNANKQVHINEHQPHRRKVCMSFDAVDVTQDDRMSADNHQIKCYVNRFNWSKDNKQWFCLQPVLMDLDRMWHLRHGAIAHHLLG